MKENKNQILKSNILKKKQMEIKNEKNKNYI